MKFALGNNSVAATATEPSGNKTSLPSPCIVLVGQIPIVTFLNPPPGGRACALGTVSASCVADAEAGPGWQGDLEVAVSLAGAPATSGTVTFSLAGVELGVAQIDATGRAKVSGVTIPDGLAELSVQTSNLTGTGTGTLNRGLVVDTLKPDAIALLSAEPLDRRETSFRLSWAAPDDGGKAAAGYDVRVSREPINASNFEAAERVSFTGAPANPTQPETISVGGRTIEKEYFFAIRPFDSAGNYGDVTASSGAIARFLSRTVDAPASEPSANAQFSFSIDGSSDINGDGRSDILVGSLAGQYAFAYLGVQDPSALGSPSVTFQGPAAVAYGQQIVNIGDIDADGRTDIAISAPGASTIYIYRGRSTWLPSYAFSDTEEGKKPDYVINLAYPSSALFGASLARLGDFNGDDVDDFAIGVPGHNGFRGRVVVVLGKEGFSGSSPETVTLEGPDSAFASFGSKVLGMGRFFSAAKGNTLVAASANLGRVYAFAPLAASLTPYPLTSATAETSGAAGYGSTLAVAGPIAGAPGLIVGSPNGGILDIWSGSPATSPFVSSRRFTNTAATNFSRIGFASAFSGSSIGASLIGDQNWDAVMAGMTEGGPAKVYIVDSVKLAALGSAQDVRDPVVDPVVLSLPDGWIRTNAPRAGVVRDYDGDGYADLVIGENNNVSMLGDQKGRFVLYW